MGWLLFGAYLVLINGYGFYLIKKDKYKAQQHQWRVPEKSFFLLALLGGALGIWIAMKVYRHKTKHASFIIGIPLIFVLQIGVCLGAFYSLSQNSTTIWVNAILK